MTSAANGRPCRFEGTVMIDYDLRDPFVLNRARMIEPTTKWKINEVWLLVSRISLDLTGE
jgi:hypothetical protein